MHDYLELKPKWHQDGVWMLRHVMVSQYFVPAAREDGAVRSRFMLLRLCRDRLTILARMGQSRWIASSRLLQDPVRSVRRMSQICKNRPLGFMTTQVFRTAPFCVNAAMPASILACLPCHGAGAAAAFQWCAPRQRPARMSA